MGWHKFCILRRVDCSALTTFYWYGIIKTTWLYKSYIIDKKLKWATSWQNQQSGMCAQRRLISLGIHPVWSESSLSAWRKLGSLATHRAHSKVWSNWADAQADQSSLGAHANLLVLSWGGSNHDLKKLHGPQWLTWVNSSTSLIQHFGHSVAINQNE